VTIGAAPTHRDGPLAFVDDIEAPALAADDHHHLARVLRTRDGAPMALSDGAGRWRTARFGTEPTELGVVRTTAAPTPVVSIAFALVKGDRPELVVQKLTELGVDRIVPFVSEHTVVRWDDARSVKQHRRFERIAREAAMQCRRVHLPVVAPVTTFAALVADGPPPLLADAGGDDLLGRGLGESGAPVTVLIGPEGGWSTAERAVGCEVVRLTDHVLRAETAAIAAATILAALRAHGAPRPGDR